MALRFSHEEKFDLLECYIHCNRNANLALERYFENFPERPQPSVRLFPKIVMNLRNHGSFEEPRPKSYEKAGNNERDENVRAYFNAAPTSSTRASARDLPTSRSTIQRVLKENKYRPYKPTIVQGLRETDYPRRMQFSNWYVNQCEQNHDFSRLVIWTDESHFTNCGVFNRHNHHFWATENPHQLAQRRLQTRFGFSVWCGMYGK